MNKAISNPLAEREAVALAQVGTFFTDMWNKIADFFTSYQWKELIFALKTASIIISLILGALIVLLLIKINIKARMKKSISEVKKAGKVKNNIIEDSQFSINENDARSVVRAYRKGLEDLGVV